MMKNKILKKVLDAIKTRKSLGYTMPKKSTKKPIKKPTKKSIKKSTKKPIKKPTKKSIKKFKETI